MYIISFAVTIIIGIFGVIVYFYWYSKKIRMLSVMEKETAIHQMKL